MPIDYQKDLPARMKSLPVDADGHPVPWFILYIGGVPDFRIMDQGKIIRALKESLCWVCGEPMGLAKGTFVIGPMCAVNRTSSEPPSHYDCGLYSARYCPFLTTPRRKRRMKDLPEHREPAGIMIERNPGVTLLWTSRRWRPWQAPNGILFDIGDPLKVEWYREGRRAQREEVLESIQSGLPVVESAARAQSDEAYREFLTRVDRAYTLLPA